MICRVLGRTGVKVSAVAFGAGPVSGLMTGSDFALQTATVARAVEARVNWFDTAPGYGAGQSEANLGRALEELGISNRVHVATKVRVPPDAFGDVAGYVRRSVEESLQRLHLPRVTLLQLHNGMTTARGDEPASLSPHDILGPGGVVEAFRRVQAAGLVQHVGLTGTGHPAAMREVIRSGDFDTLQVPFNRLNPSAGVPDSAPQGETDYGNVIADCISANMGVFAIRVFAGGALLGQPPSAHTLKTPYFPLALYERDTERAARLRDASPAESAVRFVLAHPGVTAAIIGFGSPGHVEEVTAMKYDSCIPPDGETRTL